MAAVRLRSFGRFNIVRPLGNGAQSEVYLAFDPRLEREVALKTVRLTDSDPTAVATLLREARTVSKLSHPHIVPVFEADMADGHPYLIFEYVRGCSLFERLQNGKALEPQAAARLMLPVLAAVEHAHRHNIIHRDLKPSNILLDEHGEPKVMDFGIAVQHRDEAGEVTTLMGTPAYMAPEYVSTGRLMPQADVFSAGLILYELLVGHRAIQDPDTYQALNRIAHEDIRLPDELAGAIDDRLRDVAHKALARDCALRYPTIAAFREALAGWLEPATASVAESGGGSKQSTLAFLLRRMKLRTDFPALSDAISRVNRLATSERENINTLASAILKDFALTNKILRMVNSAFYRTSGGGSISTISRAISVLGVTAVRNLAISLILFEHMQNQAHAGNLQEEFTRANLCGVLARDLRGTQARDGEEAFICAMFHRLGRMLSLYYFPEEALEISRFTQADAALSEDTAALRVLGITYEELGCEVARTWGFPPMLIRTMQRIALEAPLRKPESRDESLQLLAGFASEICRTLTQDGGGAALAKLTARFGPVLGIDEKRVRATLEQSAGEIQALASTLRLNLKESPLGQAVLRLAQSHPKRDAADLREHSLDTAAVIASQALQRPPAPASRAALGAQDKASAVSATPSAAPSAVGITAQAPNASAAPPNVRSDRQDVLATGIQDISNTMVENFQLNDVVRMVLETMYRAMDFQRVLFCLRDANVQALTGRFGFGKNADEIARKFKIPLKDPRDLFSVASTKGVDVLISDAHAPNITERIPSWFKEQVDASTFLLLPVTVRNAPVATIYADQLQAGTIVVTEKELALLRTLRNQIVLALKSIG